MSDIAKALASSAATGATQGAAKAATSNDSDVAKAIASKSGGDLWGGLIKAIGNVVGGAVEEGGKGSDPAHNQDAARSVQAGEAIKRIFTW